jgi:hypothetical protein
MITTQESARQIRARYYRERAAALRIRLHSLPFADLRSELSHLATEYERLAEYLQVSAPPVKLPHDVHVLPGTQTRNS